MKSTSKPYYAYSEGNPCKIHQEYKMYSVGKHRVKRTPQSRPRIQNEFSWLWCASTPVALAGGADLLPDTMAT